RRRPPAVLHRAGLRVTRRIRAIARRLRVGPGEHGRRAGAVARPRGAAFRQQRSRPPDDRLECGLHSLRGRSGGGIRNHPAWRWLPGLLGARRRDAITTHRLDSHAGTPERRPFLCASYSAWLRILRSRKTLPSTIAALTTWPIRKASTSGPSAASMLNATTPTSASP